MLEDEEVVRVEIVEEEELGISEREDFSFLLHGFCLKVSLLEGVEFVSVSQSSNFMVGELLCLL